MSFLQTYFDFKNRYVEVNSSIESIVASSKASAARAVYLMDPSIAEQIVKGLTYFDYFPYVGLIDDAGNVMSEVSRQELVYVNPILGLVAPNYTKLEVAVGEANLSGALVLKVNNHIALKDVYERATTTFTISLLGYMGLSLALVMLYHNSLAVPLTRLSKRLQRVNTSSITDQSIAHIKRHEANEFSLIVDSANDLLKRIASGQLLLTQRSQRFRLILDTVPSLIFAIDSEGKFAFANKSTAAFYGYSIFDLKGRSAQSVIQKFDSKLNSTIGDFLDSDERHYQQTIEMLNVNQEVRVAEVSLVKFHTFDGQSMLAVCNDVSKRVAAEKRAASLAYEDALTGLANRNKVYEILNEASTHQKDHYNVVVLADLDQFKRINDTLSHAVGDTLIKALTQALNDEFSSTGLIARLGADEFLYFEENIASDLDAAKQLSVDLAERIRSCINRDIKLSIHTYSLSASIGVVVFKNGEHTADLILQYADTAMYESKKMGRNCATLFENNMAKQAAKLLKLERDISKAIAEDEFYFVLQPIIDSTNLGVVSAEALIRWEKSCEVILPDEFIPFLEESTFIIEVGDIVLNKVCEYIAALASDNLLQDSFRIAVNISGKQFSQQCFVERIQAILTSHNVSGKHLEFEITETVALVNKQETVKTINKLKELDISFSLDDFGTGYSSLSHLKDLPVDKLKVDRSFIRDINLDAQDENLVRSIIQLSKNMGLVTVAEGVETEEQLKWLQANGDLLLQGYYFSKPVLPHDYTATFIK